MVTAQIDKTPKNKSVFQPFPDVLKRIWDSTERDWTVYSKEQFRRFWDVHVVEHRTT